MGLPLICSLNPLAFPGRAPGFDSSHIAAPGCVFSAVVTSNGGAYDYVGRRTGVITGTTWTAGINASIGPFFYANGLANYISFSGKPLVTSTNITMAAIAISKTTAASTILGSSGNGSNIGYGLRQIASGHFMITFAGNSHYTDPAILMTIGVPYFLWASLNTVTGILNYVVANLQNGKVVSAVVTGATTSSGPSSGTYVLGVDTSTNSPNEMVNAGYVSLQSFSLQVGLAWAQRPWAFWYP